VALGLGGFGETAETLRAIVRDSRYRPSVMRDAATGLGLLGDRAIVPDLLDMLREAQGLAAIAAITQSLGTIGDARTVEPLVRMLEDPETNERTRAFAAVALGIVCDKELLPWNSKLAVDANYRLAPTTLFDPGAGKGILDLL
jgi:HEAT repeat protein